MLTPLAKLGCYNLALRRLVYSQTAESDGHLHSLLLTARKGSGTVSVFLVLSTAYSFMSPLSTNFQCSAIVSFQAYGLTVSLKLFPPFCSEMSAANLMNTVSTPVNKMIMWFLLLRYYAVKYKSFSLSYPLHTYY